MRPGELVKHTRERHGLTQRQLAHRAGMHPRTAPHKPSVAELQNNGRLFPPNYLHHTWSDYLYWDSELEP